ncbi:Non-histone chromosomal protein 6 [Cytospora mali]|uniref:Non-histone chromosomal protein 6 n=1 Tax=Cytospora mali TaxID=578113 RepID=A0A194UQX2_CYTMA|nr:Non-histone chromosomal protein 6 [Valsa mali var. pyri (nom. inval.)]
MLSMPMRSAAAQALRVCGRGLPAKSLTSRVGRSFLVAPSYKLRVAARGYATATATKTTAAAKKPAAKKTAAKKPAAKKAGAKKTATKAKKSAKPTKKAAAKPKKAAKRPVNPERQKILLRRELKRKALLNQEPKNLPMSAWLVFTSQAIKADNGVRGPETLGPKMASLATEFRALSPADKQRYEQKAQENKVTNAANYKKWVESHSVAEIAEAVKARQRLNRNFKLNLKHVKITDERMPKRPAVAGWSYYIKAKSSETPGLSLGEMAKNLSQQWKGLSASEKKPYVDLAAAEAARYQKEREKALL